MRAAVVYEHGDRDVIRLEKDYPEPQAKPGWVVLKVGDTSLNFSDIFARHGMPGIKIPMPLIIGSDVAGETAEIGSGVTGWSPGSTGAGGPAANRGNELAVHR